MSRLRLSSKVTRLLATLAMIFAFLTLAAAAFPALKPLLWLSLGGMLLVVLIDVLRESFAISGTRWRLSQRHRRWFSPRYVLRRTVRLACTFLVILRTPLLTFKNEEKDRRRLEQYVAALERAHRRSLRVERFLRLRPPLRWG